MDIVVLPKPEGCVVGREVQFGKPEAEFVLEADGEVTYRSPHDRKAWYAAPSASVFKQAAECWSRYCQRVTAARTEEARVAVVAQLRVELDGLGLLGESSVWAAFVEQAEHGSL
jgi:hypothetical protein